MATAGHHLAAWLGLVPRQHATGGMPRQLGLRKRGDGYLRRQLIHGARALLKVSPRYTGKLWSWINALRAPAVRRRGRALAPKLARIVGAMRSRGETYRPA